MRFKSLLNRLAMCLVCVAGLPIVAVTILAIALTVYPYTDFGKSRISQLLALDECTRSIEVHDSAGWVGTVPTSLYRRPSHCQQYHVTTYVSDPPEAWWGLLRALENPRIGQWWKFSIRGWDLLSLAKVFLDGIWHGQPDRGASTLSMLMVRSLLELSPSSNETRPEKLRRKFTELRDAPLLYAELGGPNSSDFQRFAARQLPCSQGTSSSKIGTLYGIEQCARVLFSVSAAQTSLAQQAILAASVKKHVLIAPDNDKHGRQVALKRWRGIVNRALLALDRWGSQDDPAVEAAKAKVRQMKMPTPMFPPNFSHLLPEDSAERVATIANPMRRATHLLTGELIQALAQIKDLFGEVPSNLVGIELTLDALRNSAFKHRWEAILQAEREKHPHRYLLPLPPSSDTKLPTADVTSSVVNSKGHVVKHYSSGHDSIWGGPVAKRRNGRYVPQEENRTTGSLSKIIVALLFASKRYRTTDLLCDRFFFGLSNPDGSLGTKDCGSSSSRISVIEAFAKSRNLPIAWGLEHVQDHEIAEAVTRSGLRLQKNTPARTALAFGMLTATPRSLLRLMTAVNRGARHESARAVLPTLLKSISLLQEDGTIQRFSFDTLRNDRPIDISTPFFSKPGAPRFVAQVLSAPSQAGGTLAALDEIIEDLGGHHLLVKTGTTILKHNHQTKIRDQLVLGSFRDHTGELLSFHMLLGSPHPQHAFSDRGGMPRSGKLRLIKAMLE